MVKGSKKKEAQNSNEHPNKSNLLLLELKPLLEPGMRVSVRVPQGSPSRRLLLMVCYNTDLITSSRPLPLGWAL